MKAFAGMHMNDQEKTENEEEKKSEPETVETTFKKVLNELTDVSANVSSDFLDQDTYTPPATVDFGSTQEDDSDGYDTNDQTGNEEDESDEDTDEFLEAVDINHQESETFTVIEQDQDGTAVEVGLQGRKILRAKRTVAHT